MCADLRTGVRYDRRIDPILWSRVYYRHDHEDALQYFCSEGAGANTDRSCSTRRYERIFSGTRNDDAKRSLTDLRADRKCDRECVGSLCAL